MKPGIYLLVLAAFMQFNVAHADKSDEPLFDLLDVDGRMVQRLKTQPKSIILRYSDNLDIASFTATLNGIDVTPRFSPERGQVERVDLPFVDGENKLVLQGKESGLSARSASSSPVELTFEVAYMDLPVDLSVRPVRREMSRSEMDEYVSTRIKSGKGKAKNE